MRLGATPAPLGVVLVRHAMPVIQPDVAARLWELDDDARAAARALAQRLPRAALVVTSDQAKAHQTAREVVAVCGGTLTVDARVAETRHPPGWDPGFAEKARRFAAGQAHPGWEATEAVERRFDAAVRDAIDASAGAPIVVVTHGQALTRWLWSIGAVSDGARFWSELAFPDARAVEVELRSGALSATGPPVRLA